MNLMPYLSQSTKTAIANDAVAKCAQLIPLFMNSMGEAAKGVYPVISEDDVRLAVAEGHEYVFYQNEGFSTFVMKELRGKVIPMRINGRTVFRYASRINQFTGRPAKYIRRDSDGELYVNDEPRRRWVHPGLMPKHFMQESLRIAYEQNREAIEREVAHGILEQAAR